MQTHPNCIALYAVRVPQAVALPTASFRFYLTIDTLAVQLMVAAASPIADFHCRAIAHAGHTKNKAALYRGRFIRFFVFFTDSRICRARSETQCQKYFPQLIQESAWPDPRFFLYTQRVVLQVFCTVA